MRKIYNKRYAMIKETFGNKNDSKGYHVVTFRPERKSYSAPVVVDEIMDDDGERFYVLENGNMIPSIKYDAMWSQPKGIIKHKSYKGDNPDTTKIK